MNVLRLNGTEVNVCNTTDEVKQRIGDSKRFEVLSSSDLLRVKTALAIYEEE